ncbi:MAG: bifunctional UDP-N-acetylglucosamine diphosphorylase/glucosamine-1-phosphate N-acetyltransferase GlmU [Acetomicrobium sp.]|nr:bifunctional UDP-N-acetylglucosamine diphosphorylase/glucosamine-1-phosphate N-acetyltransferase GlmU [Acetomicrobium sp.]
MNFTWGALILAAGKGTRMKSVTAKVMQPILNEPMLSYPLNALQGCQHVSTAVVVGYGKEEVIAYLKRDWPHIATIEQKQQKGTGDAVKISSSFWENYDNLLVLPGDVPLITSDTIDLLMRRHVEKGSALSFISFQASNAVGYGRVVRVGGVVRIVEEKDATEEELKISEVNSGIYAFSTEALKRHIQSLECKNAQGEYYLTDLVEIFQSAGDRVEVVLGEREEEFLGVNDPFQLARTTALLRELILARWMERGVKCVDPSTVWIGPNVLFEGEAFISPNVQIYGRTVVGDRCNIGSFSIIRDCRLESQVHINSHVIIENSSIGHEAVVGPFAYLRDGAELMAQAFAGKFVEIKKSKIGARSKVPHLSYIGDAIIGEDTNIGAGTITCNYDGIRKHPTKIGDRCFVGSDTMLVAPVELDDDVTTGAGSVITDNVPKGALALARARQRNILGWKRKK